MTTPRAPFALSRYALVLFTLGGAGLIAILMSCLLGTTPLPMGRVIAALAGGGAPGDQVVVWEIRLPRALAAYVVGASLGVAGAALQGLLRNPLAEPGVLGVSASAALGATGVVYFGLAPLSSLGPAASAAGGAVLATGLLSVFAARIGSSVTLILVGVGLASLAGALMAVLMNLAPHPFTLSDLINWTLGSVANRSFEDIAFALPFIAGGLVMLALQARGLSALSLGEEAAAGVGLDVRKLRIAVVAGAGLATGGAVALAGAIGFVGIIAPHLVRPVARHDPARTLLPAGLLGGVLLVLADIIARLAPTQAELKLGVTVALLGAPAFIWIAARQGLGAGGRDG